MHPEFTSQPSTPTPPPPSGYGPAFPLLFQSFYQLLPMPSTSCSFLSALQSPCPIFLSAHFPVPLFLSFYPPPPLIILPFLSLCQSYPSLFLSFYQALFYTITFSFYYLSPSPPPFLSFLQRR